MNILNATELFPLKWLLFWYVNLTCIKEKEKRRKVKEKIHLAAEEPRVARVSEGPDERNFHLLKYREVILAYTRVNLNFMLTKIACLRPVIHMLYICFNYLRKGDVDQK